MTVEYDYPEFHLSMDCFWCSIVSGNLTLLEHEAAKWLSLDDLYQVQWLPADIEIIDKIVENMTMSTNINPTLSYYEHHAADFANSTTSVDFSATQKKFAETLPKSAYILDFGCGAGRDTKYFLDQGFQVDAVDGSKELCFRASEYTGIEVKQKLFQDLREISKYDAIWACASILHLEKSDLIEVMQKMQKALKSEGLIYTSFKYGDYEGERNGRYFIDMTEERFEVFLKNIKGLSIEETWVTTDVRPGRENEKWLNIFLRKN